MRLSLTARAFHLFLALIFLMGLSGEAYGLHHSHGLITSRSHHSPDPARHHQAPEKGTEEAPCTCIGTCHGAAAAPLPSHAPGSPLASTTSAWLETGRPGEFFLALPVPYLLPYANAPPPQRPVR